LNVLLTAIAGLVAVVLGITVHEFSHALSADLLGDSTARYQGRLTLNPLATDEVDRCRSGGQWDHDCRLELVQRLADLAQTEGVVDAVAVRVDRFG